MSALMRDVDLENLRVMVISSHDHGSLAEVQYFLRGQEILKNAVLLIPPRLEEATVGEKDTVYKVWSNVDDLYALVDEYQPDVIYMVCGYLLCLQEYVPPDQLASFFTHCEKSGCILLTSDPLAGALSHMITKNDAESYSPKQNLDVSGRTNYLINILIDPFMALKDIPHLFPWVSEPDLLQNHRNLGYFNPRYYQHIVDGDTKIELDGVLLEKPFWLFALGPEDYKDVVNEHGLKNIIQWTADKVRFALEQDRNVVVVGPTEFIEAMYDELGEIDGLSMHSYLAFHIFSKLTFMAEKVFFWNVLSASAILRIFFGLPTFHFEIGHMGKSLMGAYEEVVRLAFGGCEPLMVDQTVPFTKEKIENLTRQFGEFEEKRTKLLSALPEPDQVVQELIAGKKIPVWAFWQSDDIPPLVERCFESWKRHLDPEKYEIRILTHETFQDYLPFDVLSEIPHFLELRLAQQTDFMRLALLKWHGGIWLDASIYMVDDLPIDGLMDEFYATRIPSLDKNCVQSWFLVAPRQNEVINVWLDEFTIALQERRDIKLRLFSLSLYSGLLARIMRINDPQFRNYFLIYYIYENLYRTQSWFRKKTPSFTEHGITTIVRPENVKFILKNTRFAFLIKLLRRFDSTEKWKITQNLIERRKGFNRFLMHRENMPSGKMCKDGKVFLYKMNASDRLLMKSDFDFDSCP